METLRRVALKTAVELVRAATDEDWVVVLGAVAVALTVEADAVMATFAGMVIELVGAVEDAVVDADPRALDLRVTVLY